MVLAAFADMLNSPVYCPITYSMAVSPALPAPDVSAIVLDSPTRVHTFDSTNNALVNLYTVTTTCMTPLGVATATNV